VLKDELIAAIEACDEQKCVHLLNGLAEAARRAVYPSVAELYKDVDSAFRKDFGPSRSQVVRVRTTAGLAMLGTATLSELKKITPWHLHGEAQLAILADRRP